MSHNPHSQKTVIRNVGKETERKSTDIIDTQRSYKRSTKHTSGKPPRASTAPPPITTFPFVRVLSTAIILAIISATIFFWNRNQKQPSNTTRSKISALPNHETPLTGITPAEAAENFTQSTDPDQRLHWTRNITETSAHLSAYPEQALHHVPIKLIPGHYVAYNGIPIETYVALFPGGNKRTINVLYTDQGWKVDWDSYARYSSTTWQDLQQGKTKRAFMRAILHPSHIYPAPFRDENTWQCYAITSPDMDNNAKYIYGFVKKNTPTGKLLAKSFNSNSVTHQPFTFTIQSIDNSHLRGYFHITRIHALGWVLGENDIEKFQ